MTAVIAIQTDDLDKTVTIKKSYADHVENNDASAGLKVGDKVTVRQLLNAMMLPSGCDAAYALGDIYGPGQTRFVAKMNKEAAAPKMTSCSGPDEVPARGSGDGLTCLAHGR
jgi:D-alanyl-D-alanine carboxypeptidase (penicillin-binding protein 5/6)